MTTTRHATPRHATTRHATPQGRGGSSSAQTLVIVNPRTRKLAPRGVDVTDSGAGAFVYRRGSLECQRDC